MTQKCPCPKPPKSNPVKPLQPNQKSTPSKNPQHTRTPQRDTRTEEHDQNRTVQRESSQYNSSTRTRNPTLSYTGIHSTTLPSNRKRGTIQPQQTLTTPLVSVPAPDPIQRTQGANTQAQHHPHQRTSIHRTRTHPTEKRTPTPEQREPHPNNTSSPITNPT